eukprot:TRINITY_DN3541_c0_g1_i1.p1 TRINITY_DN3541_c0_g1~~TRINITY_DN3541_c0_g1_i1.p1  ORF type:complete len:359 (-),score=139.73 TRINITY_DN3541_c0_g1_i1:41-1117(-)
METHNSSDSGSSSDYFEGTHLPACYAGLALACCTVLALPVACVMYRGNPQKRFLERVPLHLVAAAVLRALSTTLTLGGYVAASQLHHAVRSDMLCFVVDLAELWSTALFDLWLVAVCLLLFLAINLRQAPDSRPFLRERVFCCCCYVLPVAIAFAGAITKLLALHGGEAHCMRVALVEVLLMTPTLLASGTLLALVTWCVLAGVRTPHRIYVSTEQEEFWLARKRLYKKTVAYPVACCLLILAELAIAAVQLANTSTGSDYDVMTAVYGLVVSIFPFFLAALYVLLHHKVARQLIGCHGGVTGLKNAWGDKEGPVVQDLVVSLHENEQDERPRPHEARAASPRAEDLSNTSNAQYVKQ